MENFVYYLTVPHNAETDDQFKAQAIKEDHVLSLQGLENWLNGATEDPEDIKNYEFRILLNQ